MTAKRVKDLTTALNKAAFVGSDGRVRELIGVFQKLNSDPEGVEPLVLVTGAQGHVVGMVTPLDMLRAVEPEFMEPDYNCAVCWPGLFKQRCRNIADKPIGEITQPLVTVDAQDTLMTAVNHIRRRQVDTLLVVDGDRVMGTLDVRGLLKEIGDDAKAKVHAVA